MIKLFEYSINKESVLKGYTIFLPVQDEIVTTLYAEMFDMYPEVKLVYEASGVLDYVSETLNYIKYVADHLEDEALLDVTLRDLAVQCDKCSGLAAFHPVFIELLLSNCKKRLGRRWTKAIATSWGVLLSAMSQRMFATYRDTGEVLPVTNEAILHLQSVQDISKSQALKNDMLLLVNDNDEIHIDGSTVERIDGSALQLLCALFIYARKNNLIIHWLQPSEVLILSSKVVGVDKVLELC